MAALFPILCVLANLPQIMSIFHTVTPEWLAQHMNSVVILDVTYDKKPKPNPEEFMKTRYGRFEEMMREKPKAYVEEHIPGAVLFNIDAAFYPSKYIRFDLYPPQVFEKYIRLLGVNNDDHVIVYGRGPFAGMMWPAKAWWALKVYGHGKVSVLDGGLDAWKKAGYPVTNQVVHRKPGNFTAKPLDDTYLVTFEELEKKNKNGKSLFDELNTINYLDARPSGQFHGTEPLEVPAPGATGAHLKGAKNVPLVNVISQNGLKSKEEISHALKRAGYRAALPVITACNTGVQAALLALVLEKVKIKARVYNGSMAEIGLRAPYLINQK
ncbi:hypothetical protein V3C99_009273 [Haemonchus contortus]|uniref:Rhodanese domain containing protein n=1 Tax=Haemonchus contortus TaxID=6289 RepID=A0A7I4YLN4_HAECO|nr:Rhodanese domain containing protein [Haemonchus contortus]